MTFSDEMSNLLKQAYNTKKWELVLEVIQRLENVSFETDDFDGDLDEQNEEPPDPDYND